MAKNTWLASKKAKDKKCSYVALSPGEIKKLKVNGLDPHKIKGSDSKREIFKCKPSGNLKVMRKSKIQDQKTGEKRYPEPEEEEDTGININDLPWPDKKGKNMDDDQEIIEFRVTGFDDSSFDLLDKLKIDESHRWKAGDIRAKNTLLTHRENGFKFVAADEKLDFDQRVERLLDDVFEKRSKLKRVGGKCQLFCALYFSGSNRPAVSFPENVVQKLAKLNATVDVDLYYVASTEAEAA